MNALNDPDTLADIDIPEGSADFEKYGYVACYAYAKKVALEKEGPNSILLDYTSWIAENSERLQGSFEKYPLKNIDNNQRLINAYVRKLSIKYDIHDVLDKQPLCKETIAEIMSEIKLKPDWIVKAVIYEWHYKSEKWMSFHAIKFKHKILDL